MRVVRATLLFMKSDLLQLLFSISLKTRILREWQKANRAQDQAFSERELLVLELIEDLGPVTEKGLGKIFGLASSSVSELITKLGQWGLIDMTLKARGKPLKLTRKGKEKLLELKQVSSTRYTYLFEGLDDSQVAPLAKIFAKIDENAGHFLEKMVFDRYSAQ